GEQIEAWAADADWPTGVEVDCLDTGLDTPTGGRIKLAAPRIGDGAFSATYADGVADIDLAALADAHREGGSLATVTAVQPSLHWGGAAGAGAGGVGGFQEKPGVESWITGGFFCFEPGVLDYLADGSVLEREPLEHLASDGELRAYRHAGFWDCMDTYKDATL